MYWFSPDSLYPWPLEPKRNPSQVGSHWLIYGAGCTHSQCHVSPVLGSWSDASEGLEATLAYTGLFSRPLGGTFERCPFECDLLFFWRTPESRPVLGNGAKEWAVLHPSPASPQAAYLQREEACLGDLSLEEHTGCNMPSVSHRYPTSEMMLPVLSWSWGSLAL